MKVTFTLSFGGMESFMMKSLTLEMSFKPFKKNEDEYIKAQIEKLFNDYKPLAEKYESVAVLFWLADGSEILDYKGNLDEKVEWAKYMGGANRPMIMTEYDPNAEGLHSRCYDYIKNPPEFTYKDVKKIIGFVKEIGKKVYGGKKQIRVGETFDPGPEFAKSEFKYKKHPEICPGATMGNGTFVYCCAKLNADSEKYAAYPNGIPQDTAFGEFFGKQCKRFFDDMGFDYLWLSNGLGFGLETWSTVGAVFDGEKFDADGFEKVSENILDFWKLFRKACPDVPVETRGTNMTVGIDFATDGVPIKEIYENDFNMLAPPNSPWAALNGDFGLELCGYMSRIANLPKNENFLFRYYIHDPWWVNSPWYDRYEGQPHDIYMPLAVGRVDANGDVKTPTHMNILSVDNSYGDMPDSCVREPMVHILKAFSDLPDDVSPVVWVYPFNEYSTTKTEEAAREMFFGDWFIRSAINNGFPLTSVVSTNNFETSIEKKKDMYMGSVLLSTIPIKNSSYEKCILDYIERGGKVIFYGSVRRASEAILKVIGVKISGNGVSGDVNIEVDAFDKCNNGEYSKKIMHRPLICDGNIDTIKDENSDCEVLAKIGGYCAATANKNVCWVRGTNSNSYTGDQLLEPDDEKIYYRGDSLLRVALAHLGADIRFEKYDISSKNNVIMISRHDNAYMFSTYSPDTTVKTKMKFEKGAPILMGYETVLENGYSTYTLPRAEHKECHVFVEQNDGIVSCKEQIPVDYKVRRKIVVKGLKNATLRFYGDKYCADKMYISLNPINEEYWFVSEEYDGEYKTDGSGTYFEMRNVTGNVYFMMPRVKYE